MQNIVKSARKRRVKMTSFDRQGNEVEDTKTGKVKKWFDDKGFGFITSEGKDYFAHVTKLNDGLQTLSVGNDVEFRTIESVKGVQAVDVSLVN